MSKVEIIDNLKIINKDGKKICIKKSKYNNILQIDKYLYSKGFNNYIDTKIVNGYEIRDFFDEISINEEDKLYELVYLLTILHTKTTHYKNYAIDDIKDFYEKEINEISSLKLNYNNIFDRNVINLINTPSINLLINEFSIFLKSFDLSRNYLDKWYLIVKEKKRKRVVLNHNNLKLSNFIVSNNRYLINWYNSIIDYPIYDFLSLFKNNYDNIDMVDAFSLYEAKYGFLEEEKYLLISKLLRVDNFILCDSELLNTKEIYDRINYLKKVNNFLNYYMKN